MHKTNILELTIYTTDIFMQKVKQLKEVLTIVVAFALHYEGLNNMRDHLIGVQNTPENQCFQYEGFDECDERARGSNVAKIPQNCQSFPLSSYRLNMISISAERIDSGHNSRMYL